ncbi:unnamed protein product [Mortierella alpina]
MNLRQSAPLRIYTEYNSNGHDAGSSDTQQNFSDTSSVISDAGSDQTLAERLGSRKQLIEHSFASGSTTLATSRSRYASRSNSKDKYTLNATVEAEPFSSEAPQWQGADRPHTLLQKAHLPLELPTDRPRLPHRPLEEQRWPLLLGTRPTLLLRDLPGSLTVGLKNANSDRESIFAGGSAYDRTMHADFSGEPDTLQLLERIQSVVSSSDSHDSSLPRPPHANPATSVSVAFSCSALIPSDPLQAPSRSGFELELHVHDADDHIEGVICYTPALFETTTIERFAGYITSALERMALDPTRPTTKLGILPPFEHALVVQAWNTTHTPYPSEICLHHLLSNRPHAHPTLSLLLTYTELDARSNRLASKLIQLGARPDMLVAISVERSLGRIIGILAILKAGAAYVPLDPSYPGSRLGSILDETAPTILVADRAGQDAIGEAMLSTMIVVNPNTLLDEEDTRAPRPVGLTSRHLAYTGKPKGVTVEHQGTVNLVCYRPAMFGIRPASRYLQFTSFGFSHSVSETFSTLIAELSEHDAAAVTWAIITAGKAVPPSLPLALKTLAPNCSILNNYGASEFTSDAVWTCPENYTGGVVPFGRPIPNKRVYLLDAHRNPVPIGSVGEIYIGGVGLARGYLNLPQLTAEKFIFDPFVGEGDARMYMTGDLARSLPDGTMLYLGRNDHQVKIRGFRVELGEIESCLRDHPSVEAAVVVSKGEEDHRRLTAYVMMNLALTLRTHLAAQLPEYMVSIAFVRMAAFPVNANGKLDRRALPEPSEDSLARQTYEEPQGEIETALAAI